MAAKLESVIMSHETSFWLAYFEAPELSYPIMTFPSTFWKPQNQENLEINQMKELGFSKKSAERAWFETSNIKGVGIDPNRLESV